MLPFRFLCSVLPGILFLCAGALPLWGGQSDSRRELILQTIQGSRRALLERQFEDGLFPADGYLTHQVGATALATLALIKTATSFPDADVERSISALRRVDWGSVTRTHELALGLMALIAVHQQEDVPLIQQLTRRLVQLQREDGGWSHRTDDHIGDLSITSFVLIALRDARRSRIPIPEEVWRRASAEIQSLQRADGGWYDFAAPVSASVPEPSDAVAVSTLTGTITGLCALSICEEGLESVPDDFREAQSSAMSKARDWLHNQDLAQTRVLTPASIASFHLLGIEMANRPRGFLFPNEARWHEIGVHSLLMTRNQTTERWPGTNDVISTSYALLCLASRRGPVTIHRLSLSESIHSPCPHDVWNLNELFVRRRGWPRIATCRDVTLDQLSNLSEPPRILYLTSADRFDFTENDVAALRLYLDRGGLLLASPQGDATQFDEDLRRLISRLYRREEGELAELPVGHPVYRMEIPVDARDVPLYALDAGCRTTIFYSPVNLSDVWEHVSLQQWNEPGTVPPVTPEVAIGLNILAYVSDPAPPTFPRPYDRVNNSPTVPVTGPMTVGELYGRHLMRIGQLRVPGLVSPAPLAWNRPIARVNAFVGPLVEASPALVSLESSEIFDSPLLVLHGARRFQFSPEELERLRQHLRNGGLLFADACCGSQDFDVSFREMVRTLFPDSALRPVPLEHPFYSMDSRDSLKEMHLRTVRTSPEESASESEDADRELPQFIESLQEPELEGVEIDGRLVIIYSRYDLSCTLQKSAGRFCEGYLHDDAVRLAANVILYSFLREERPDSN